MSGRTGGPAGREVEALREARVKRRLPMSAVAAAIGCTAARYARIESGSAPAGPDELEAIRAVLGPGSGAR